MCRCSPAGEATNLSTWLAWIIMVDEKTIIAFGYESPRRLASGEWAAIMRFLFTTGLIVGIEELGYRTRFCYRTREEALEALSSWNGTGDPPGEWIKEKGNEGDRDNPKGSSFEEIPIVTEPKS